MTPARLCSLSLSLAVLSLPAAAATSTNHFRGTLSFVERVDPTLEVIAPEIDGAIRSLLDGALIDGAFLFDDTVPGAPRPAGGTAYDRASTSLDMEVGGSAFLDDDPDACHGVAGVVCVATIDDDRLDAGAGGVFDSYALLSEVVRSEPLTRAIEAASGASADVPIPGTGLTFRQPVIGSIGIFAFAVDLLDSEDLVAPAALPTGDLGMTFVLDVLDGLALPGETGARTRYEYRVTGLELSDSPLDPRPPAPIPLPATAWILLAGLGSLAGLRRLTSCR